jgi:hypothetical protein
VGVDADIDEYGYPYIEFTRIQQRHGFFDDPGLLEFLDPAPAGVFAQADAVGQFGNRHIGVLLQILENPPVGTIYHFFPSLLAILGYFPKMIHY